MVKFMNFFAISAFLQLKKKEKKKVKQNRIRTATFTIYLFDYNTVFSICRLVPKIYISLMKFF